MTSHLRYAIQTIYEMRKGGIPASAATFTLVARSNWPENYGTFHEEKNDTPKYI
jgi:hypothetical protein